MFDDEATTMFLSMCVTVALGRRLVSWTIIAELQHMEDKSLQLLFSVKISIINNNLPPSGSNVFQGTENKYFISHGLRWVNFVFAVQCYNLILITNRYIHVEEGTLQSYCNHEILNYHGTSSVHV